MRLRKTERKYVKQLRDTKQIERDGLTKYYQNYLG